MFTEMIGDACRRRITTATLNMVVREAVAWRSPPSRKGDTRKGRIYYGTQVLLLAVITLISALSKDVDAQHASMSSQAATRPPSFVLFVNDVKLFGDDYKLYMERQIRENVGYRGTPLASVLERQSAQHGTAEEPRCGRLMWPKAHDCSEHTAKCTELKLTIW